MEGLRAVIHEAEEFGLGHTTLRGLLKETLIQKLSEAETQGIVRVVLKLSRQRVGSPRRVAPKAAPRTAAGESRRQPCIS